MVPLPALVRPKVDPPMAPPTVKVLLETVTVREAFMVTAPAPMSRLPFVPRKPKSPFQF